MDEYKLTEMIWVLVIALVIVALILIVLLYTDARATLAVFGLK